MENTQNQAPLPKAMEEVELVSKICESMEVKPVISGSVKQDALNYLRSSKIFHFAGHGYTDRTNPSKSHLCFCDASDPLTVANLLELNLHEESPFLAYLSACSTGRVQDEQFIDESIHLISACQLAGFRHIIGTLWRVQDEHCVDVARITYETIKEEGMTDDSVCRGLHRATRVMRDIWLDSMDEDGGSVPRTVQQGERGARDIISCEEDSVAPAYWVPYVHFGV
jgi:CHAT domain-containing protein